MHYIYTIILFSIAALGMAWAPSLAKTLRLSFALIYVIFGATIYSLFNFLPTPDPFTYPVSTFHVTEFAVIISVMGTALKIDQAFTFKKWRIPFRLVSITMLTCIAVVAALGYFVLKLDLASSILLGAVLAPTDPVLASDVQVGAPNEKEKHRVKFSLTAEAGMNDGTAFPFTHLAILTATIGGVFTFSPLIHWLWFDLLYRISAGVIIGFIFGKLLARFIFSFSEKSRMFQTQGGFVGIASALVIYGITESLMGYGFIAVFVLGITLRNYEMQNGFHKEMHEFIDQVERILVAVVLIFLGGSFVNGILNYLNLISILFCIGFLFVIRPASGILALTGIKMPFKEKIAISFFGIKGIGSFFYLAYAFQQTGFKYEHELWSIVAFVVLISIVVHGLSAHTIMKKLQLIYDNPSNPGKRKKSVSNKP